jgi:hypothetical protein
MPKHAGVPARSPRRGTSAALRASLRVEAAGGSCSWPASTTVLLWANSAASGLDDALWHVELPLGQHLSPTRRTGIVVGRTRTEGKGHEGEGV